jgi:membrane fusion protein (multidrug efflux system)
VVIPFKAVTEQLGEYFVYKVKVDSSKVTQQRVSIGKQIGRNVIVKNGLQDGEVIVTEGVQNLREGSMIAGPENAAAKEETAKKEVKH